MLLVLTTARFIQQQCGDHLDHRRSARFFDECEAGASRMENFFDDRGAGAPLTARIYGN